jgi:CheY-like chemotaxis protein
LLDIGMPHMSGYDVARAIGGMNLELRPTIVAVSGWGQPADKDRARAAGFTSTSQASQRHRPYRLLAQVAARRGATRGKPG